VVALVRIGTRLRSVTCTTQVIVVRAPEDGVDDLRCGGVPMVDLEAPEQAAPLVAEFDGGSDVGKRYVDAADTIEVLCTKAGHGSLSFAGEVLEIKAAKPLPASD
jgi:hypothetical protein